MQILTMNFYEQESRAQTSSSPNQPSQKLVLAESQPIIFNPILSQLRKYKRLVILCSSYQQLVETCTQESPDILVLGTLPHMNCLEVYRRCHNHWPHLPIIMLANQPVVNDYFKTWALKRGISNVVSSYPQAFPLLFAAIKDVEKAAAKQRQLKEISLPPPPSLEEIFSIPTPMATAPETMELRKAIVALNQLTDYSRRYFGPLAIGNYWKKARNSLIKTHPWLKHWSIDHVGKISYLSNSSESEKLTTEQFHSLQVWTEAFIQEGQRVVVDFLSLLQSNYLSPQVDQLICSPFPSTGIYSDAD